MGKATGVNRFMMMIYTGSTELAQGRAGRQGRRRGRKASKREMRWPRDGTSAMNRGVIILVTGKAGINRSINIEIADHDLVIVIPEKLELHNLTCDRSFFLFFVFALFWQRSREAVDKTSRGTTRVEWKKNGRSYHNSIGRICNLLFSHILEWSRARNCSEFTPTHKKEETGVKNKKKPKIITIHHAVPTYDTVLPHRYTRVIRNPEGRTVEHLGPAKPS